MLLSIRNLDILDHLQLDIYACMHYSFNQRLLVIYHILGIYKDKVNNLQFFSHYKIFPFLASSSEISVSIRGKKRQPTTFIILTLFSK